MADSRGTTPKSGDNDNTSTRPARLRVMRPEVKEFLTSPRRRRPKKQPPPPPPPPPRKVKLKERKNKEKGKAATEEDKFERAQYNCPFQDEGEGGRDFAPQELVWGKVRSHSWWPGQVFDAADASEIALQHRKAGALLIAYFWDRTFAWSSPSALLPFRSNFTRLSAQSTMSSFVSAIDSALQEVGRRVEAGLSCGCFTSSIATKQEVQNSGIRQGAYGAAVDSVYTRDAFHSKTFLDYISALGKKPLAGADLLDLATAKAQLRALNRSRGSRDLPEFEMFEGTDEITKMTHTDGDDTLSRGKKSKRMKSSSKKKTDISKHLDGLKTGSVADSRTLAKKAVGDALSERKSGRTLRSTSKKEDALEGLKRLAKDGIQELTGKSKDAPILKEKNQGHGAGSAHKKGRITEDGYHRLGDSNAEDPTSPGKRRLGHNENSISKRVPISEHGRKKKKLSELMAETGKPNSASSGKSKTRGKRSLHDSAEKTEDPEHHSKDTLMTRKRKKLNTLGDLSSLSEPLSRKKSTKVGELMSKVAGSSMLQAAPAVKANSAVSQTKPRRAKYRQVNAADKSPCPVKVNQGNSEAVSKESLSCGEMLWQLSVAACGLQQKEKIVPTSVNFFTGFRKNNFSSSDVNEGMPEKAANTESTLSEQPIADHMQDDYWADILINVEEPLSSLKKKIDESKKRVNKKAPQVKKPPVNSLSTTENVDEPRSEGNQDTGNEEQLRNETKLFSANGSQLKAGTKFGQEMENCFLSGLVLHFSRPCAVPSQCDLIKIFSQYGPVNEVKADVANSASSAQVIFKRRMDAEAAFAGAGKISALGPALVSFRLTDFPASASGNKASHVASKSE
ncbi:hypothetical protein Zm00014a_036505 [Zea mays]|uniref:PWWP domain-containing protein n=1 Tax=Zea mays TaxID=4577 RepID=A0A3L6FLX5_MAIZE|nr:hypothetical protein Zm00014a_036505 [Zea mays]